MESTETRRAPGHAALDVPFTLALAFWVGIVELILGRGLGVVLTYHTLRSSASFLASALVLGGVFCGYFCTLLCLVLGLYVGWQLVSRPGFLHWALKIVVGVSVLAAILVSGTLLIAPSLPMPGEAGRVVVLALAVHASIAFTGVVLGGRVLAMHGPTWDKKLFAVVPVIVILLAGASQLFYFLPLAQPAWLPDVVPRASLASAHILAIVLPFALAAFMVWQHARSGLPIFIHALVALSAFFPCLMLANMPGALLRDFFFGMLGTKVVLPAPGIVYPIAMLPLAFVLSALVGTPVADSASSISRRRAGFSLGLMYVGAFAPLTAAQAACLLLGLILWIKSITLD